jgi:hypothetical protein
MSGRLSQDDVTPRGNRVAFDVERWLAGTVPGQPVDAAAAAAAGGASRRFVSCQPQPGRRRQ